MPYEEKFPAGTEVKIAVKEELEKFKRDWKFHHPLETQQLQYGDAKSRVERVFFYHGGDVLYELSGVPGIWHEQCLRRADARG